ncbi:MAG: hypothetical protein IKA84_01175 [Clostridia bacterium]|nr:hypothetical protein [Clostridia bacterium]
MSRFSGWGIVVYVKIQSLRHGERDTSLCTKEAFLTIINSLTNQNLKYKNKYHRSS